MAYASQNAIEEKHAKRKQILTTLIQLTEEERNEKQQQKEKSNEG
jgi:hypothetical protein